MPKFTLTSKAKPSQIRGKQPNCLYEAMQALGSSAMFDEIAAECKKLGYGNLIHSPGVTIHASVMHHLHNWETENPPIVTVEYD